MSGRSTEPPLPQDRLQPALLDRLTDLEPDAKVESRDKRVLTKAALREAVLRDLAWLFNSTHQADASWAPYAHARQSVLNFGLPPLSGETASTLDVPALEAAVRRAILDFEPRIVARSLKVQAQMSDLQLNHHNVLSIQITGMLWAQPVPLEMTLRTELDLETGQVEVHDLSR
jgi:type VI secretion system protein ImpF